MGELEMETELARSLPRLRRLPGSLPLEGAVRIELEEGVPILRASSTVQKRVDALLMKEREQGLTSEEMEEFDGYEEVDDYLGLVNRLIRNLLKRQPNEN